MTQPPTTRYARRGDIGIAYQVTGSGPIDLVMTPGFVSHLDHLWDEPAFARFLHRLGSFCRLICFDKRGTGLSDRGSGTPSLEQRMDDIRAVMDSAIRCACAMRDDVRRLGLEIRAGLHTGEIELIGDDIGGIAVHTASRVAAKAEANEVWASRTVCDLVAGSGLEFPDRGAFELKGIPGTWPLYAVA